MDAELGKSKTFGPKDFSGSLRILPPGTGDSFCPASPYKKTSPCQ